MIFLRKEISSPSVLLRSPLWGTKVIGLMILFLVKKRALIQLCQHNHIRYYLNTLECNLIRPTFCETKCDATWVEFIPLDCFNKHTKKKVVCLLSEVHYHSILFVKLKSLAWAVKELDSVG